MTISMHLSTPSIAHLYAILVDETPAGALISVRYGPAHGVQRTQPLNRFPLAMAGAQRCIEKLCVAKQRQGYVVIKTEPTLDEVQRAR